MDYWTCLVLWHALAIPSHGVVGLKLTNFLWDKYPVRGNDSLLECRYDLQNETLYSVKWYKDNLEFYRFVPKDFPVVRLFPVPGVYVDVEHSNETQVRLTALDLNSSGRYRCEVSTDAPSFQTVSDYGDMVTVVLPDRGLFITGIRPRYNIGDTVNVNCTSGASKPAADLFLVHQRRGGKQLVPPWPLVVNRGGGGSGDDHLGSSVSGGLSPLPQRLHEAQVYCHRRLHRLLENQGGVCRGRETIQTNRHRGQGQEPRR